MTAMDTGIMTREHMGPGESALAGFPYRLLVWNDDVNTFDWVIQSLVEVCGHTTEQAEQCALIIHFSGKYAVKEGDFEEIRPMCEALLDRGISATVEQVPGPAFRA